MSSGPLSIPTPVGGVVTDTDRIPSVVFAVAWAALLPFVVRRFAVPRRRTTLLIGVCILVILDLVLFSIRASQAFDASKRAKTGLLIFMQSMLANGFITLMTDSIPLLTAIIQNARKEPTADPEALVAQQAEKKKYTTAELVVIVVVVTYIVMPGTLAGVQGGLYRSAQKKQGTADVVQGIRYASAVLALIPIFIMAGVAIHGLLRLPRIDRAACLRFLTLLSLLTIIIIYRFIAMAHHVPSLKVPYTGPGSLTTTTAKTLFYVLHCLPEWVAAALVLIPDTTAAFGAKPVWPKRKTKRPHLEVQPRLYEDPIRREPEAEYVEMVTQDSSTQVDKVKPFGR